MMQPSKLGKLAQKYRSLVRLSSSPLDPARKSLLAYLVESNIFLSVQEDTEYQRLIDIANSGEVRTMLDIDELFRDLYKNRYEAHGIAKGIEQGLLQGERNVLLKQIREKFGELPETMAAKIETLHT